MSKPDETTKCARCQELKPLREFWKSNQRKEGRDYYCKTCRKECNIKNMDKVKKALYRRRYNARHKEKRYAHNVVSRLVKTGKIVREDCFLCGDKNSEGHHLNYKFPDKVIWLCREHHEGVHHD